MAISQRKKTNMLLTFKVLQFVNQLRRRIRPRTRDGSTSLCQLGTDTLGLRAVKSISNGLPRLSTRRTTRLPRARKRVCKRRKPIAKLCKSSSEFPIPAAHVSASQDGSVSELQHTAGHGLSTVAANDGLFLKHDNAPMFEGFSLNQMVQLLVTVQEAINILHECRSLYSDDWLMAQGLHLGLDMDENFIANYKHLLLRLQADLTEALTHKALEELLRGGYDKRQRKLLSWFSEFAEKRRPLSTCFPWSIKPSLAVLWGVCWMFYYGHGHGSIEHETEREIEHDGRAGNRVRQDRVLQHLDFPNVPWSAPASSDYMNFGLELIGAQPQHSALQPSSNDNVTTGLEEVFQARNAETWQSDLSPLLDFRLPERGEVGATGPLRYDQPAPPQLQLPDQSTYYRDGLQQLSLNLHNSSYLPHNPGSPLTVFPHLGNTGLNQSWQYPSLPQTTRPRHLIPTTPQHPSIRLTDPAGSDITQPHSDFVASASIYHHPEASPLHLNTTFGFPYDTFNMTSPIPQDSVSMQLPGIPIKHERTSSIHSNSNMPTPVSLGPRSPMLSPTSVDRPSIATSPNTHSRNISEDRSSLDRDDEDGTLRKNYSFKRAEEPPRNQDGKMLCIHQECAGISFDRKCEWSKHMDKHDRPYKCNFKGCEKLQGFTYSGGLLRHEREVHKLHGGTKKSLFCPFNDCKRSSGAGFTRKENLAEHVRRVHRRTSMSADMHGLIIRRDTIMESSPIPEGRRASETPFSRIIEYRDDDDMSLKRKRGSDSGLSDRDNEDLRTEVKRLRHENEEKDSRLRQLEQAVIALQHQTRR
ncbi:hypothetical protein GQ44DRAFT_615096 [Phaeosphaeriaceae sp. PMI808]|nr:hypothetical protein GQ44DRAFT_615096 [Phaeosphaeriaceae sp. PMI808]